MIVDHKNKMVIDGSQVMKVSELLDFTSPEEKLANFEHFIKAVLEAHPKIITALMNKKLRRSRARISKG